MGSEARPGGTIILSQIEKDILKMVVKGMLNKQIAAVRGVKKDTIKNEIISIFNKLAVSRRVELVLKILDTDNRGEHCHFRCVVCKIGECKKVWDLFGLMVKLRYVG
jgi:DNA-binding CsgD family transcriptional regulator